METTEAEVLFEPENESLRFLPEGPYRCQDGRLSWVAIQHGTDETCGSLNILDLTTLENTHLPLTGRPGFAFPTDRDGVFVVGMERAVVLFDTDSGQVSPLASGIDHDVAGTIINDGVTFEGHLVFGCKDLNFAEKKAGLYLLRRGETTAVRLSDSQVCSNGKALITHDDGTLTLLDICSCSKQIVAGDIDIAAGTLKNNRVLVDLTSEPVFPDGMILTPDEQSLIVAIYDPRDVPLGQARQYSIASGELEATWICPQSPRVTCPQLIERRGNIELLLTTADEGMTPELRSACSNAGCLFVAPTNFTELNDAPPFAIISA